jgi:hypothetical protein
LRSSLLLPFLCIICAISVIISFIFSTSPPLHAEYLPHHSHIHHIKLISGFAISVCVHQSSSSSSCSGFMYFLVLRPIRFIELLSHQQGTFLSPWFSPMDLVQLPTCVSLQRTQKWRLSGLFTLPLYASLESEPQP